MPRRAIASRRKFHDSLAELERRRRAGEFRPAREADADRPARRGQRTLSQLFRELFRLLGDQRLPILVSMMLLTLSTLLALAPPAATKITIDYVLGDKPMPAWVPPSLAAPDQKLRLLFFVGVAIIVLTAFENIVHLTGRWLATRATKRVQVAVKRRAFDHASRLPLHRVYELKSGGVASLLREDAGGIGDLIFSMIFNPWRAVVQLAGSLVVLAWVDWRLLVGACVLLPVVLASHSVWTQRIRPLYRDIRRRRQDIDSQATEAFGGMRVVRAFDRRRTEASRFVGGNHLMARQELRAWWFVRLLELLWELILPTASAGLLLYGGWQVLSGSLTLGDLVMFLIYLSMLLAPLGVMINSVTEVQRDLAGMERVLDLLAEPVEMPPAPDTILVDKERVEGRITIDGVSFHYPGSSEPVLSDLDLDVRPGEVIALVGPSGAGKTSLCNLIARFYDPTAGAIRLDGIDLRRLEVNSYRRLFGIVEQEIFLFDGTVAENIGYAARAATDADIRRAAQVANADGFIARFEHGYDTVIGERGVRLSGGQRQRVAIARAILADPKILILDEATSNLDTESERAIQQGLWELMRGRTSFVIAHRLSTIAHADRIVVLEHGRIVEVGTHAELMGQSTRYRQMVLLQTAEMHPAHSSP